MKLLREMRGYARICAARIPICAGAYARAFPSFSYRISLPHLLGDRLVALGQRTTGPVYTVYTSGRKRAENERARFQNKRVHRL
jgi:hypothetical protein